MLRYITYCIYYLHTGTFSLEGKGYPANARVIFVWIFWTMDCSRHVPDLLQMSHFPTFAEVQRKQFEPLTSNNCTNHKNTSNIYIFLPSPWFSSEKLGSNTSWVSNFYLKSHTFLPKCSITLAASLHCKAGSKGFVRSMVSGSDGEPTENPFWCGEILTKKSTWRSVVRFV